MSSCPGKSHQIAVSRINSTTKQSSNIFVPVHIVPFPENSFLHVHWKDPLVLWHVALLWHGETTKEVSSISIVFSQICKQFWSELRTRGCPGNYYQILLLEQQIKQLNNICIFLYLCTLFHFLKIHCYMYIEKIHQYCCMLHYCDIENAIKHIHWYL